MKKKAAKNKDPKQVTYAAWLQQSAIRVGRAHFAIGLLYVITIVLYDAFRLITSEALLDRWIMASGLLAVSAVLWYVARSSDKSNAFYANLLYGFIVLDLVYASFGVYVTRGMVSPAVILYVIPLVVAALLLRKAALYMTAILAAASYSLSAIWYFVDSVSEGYRIQLYGEVGFYSAIFFVVAALLWDVVRSKNADDS